LPKLLLDDGRDAPADLVLRRLVRQPETGERAVTVGIGEPGFVEEPPRPRRIERHRGKIRIVRPGPGREDRGDEVGTPLPDRRTIVSRSIARAIARRTLSSDSARSRRFEAEIRDVPPRAFLDDEPSGQRSRRSRSGSTPLRAKFTLPIFSSRKRTLLSGTNLTVTDRIAGDRRNTVVCGKDRLAVGREVVDPVGACPTGGA